MSARAVYDRVRANVKAQAGKPPAEPTGASRRKSRPVRHVANSISTTRTLPVHASSCLDVCGVLGELAARRGPLRAPRSVPIGTKTCQDLASRLRNDASSSRDGYEIGQRVLHSWSPIEHLWTLRKHDNVSASQGAVGKKLGTGFVTSPGALGSIGIFGGSVRTTFGRRRIVRGASSGRARNSWG